VNNADNAQVDIEQERTWLNDHKLERGLSWSQIAAASGIPAGTLSPFATNRYAGDNQRIAREVFRYRQMLQSQSERSEGVQVDPGYFETPTASRLRALLVIAHMGRMTVGATGPGTGKTMAMEEYKASASNVWIATMEPTSKSLNAMIGTVLRAVGGTPKGGWTRQLSDQVKTNIAGRRGLLVIDEANHLEFEAIEQIRAWHDATKVGVCLLGNEELMMRIRGGPRRDAFARLNSRIAQSHIQNLPLADDVAAFCDAWKIEDAGMRSLLTRIALTPGAGGLRECRQIVEGASMLAVDDGRPLSLADLRFAQETRATRNIRD
jgi:DNA transposition AAA+ family ATPase